MKNLLKDWTLFEKVWLSIFTAINIYLFFAWGDSLIGLVSSLSGMLCVVLVAKGKISNYYFGIIQAATYAYISYTYGLYGETMLNALFYLPIQFIGLYMWSKWKNKSDSTTADIFVKRLDLQKTLQLVGGTLAGIILLAIILNLLNGYQVGIDSATTIISIAAQILMLKRYAEQWLLWIMVNVLSIIMWAIALIQTGGNDFTILIMWVAFLFNSIYGYINWLKMAKKQKESLQ